MVSNTLQNLVFVATLFWISKKCAAERAFPELFMDSNAIIEAHRLRCWPNLIAFFSVETFDMCARERASGGQQLHRTYVPVDTNALREKISAESPEDRTTNLLSFAPIGG
ncbi:MAG: hypothetical protein ABFR33_09560 [Verrucomicrobiota bacterium]